MIKVLPSWYRDAEDKLSRLITDITNENNINFYFVSDRKTIESCKQAILITLVTIQENARPEFDPKDFEEFKEFKKEKQKRK